MQDWLRERARATPEATALIIGNEEWSYGQLDQLVTDVADQVRLYARREDRVAVLAPNSLLYVCLIHAAARIGAVLVPLNSRHTIHENRQQLELSNCQLLVYDPSSALSGGELQSEKWKCVPGNELWEKAQGRDKPTGGMFAVESVQAIIFTSGTSGKPKGALLTFANHLYSAMASAYRLGVLPHDRWLCCLPLYHVGGQAIVLRSCLYGTTVVLQERFEATSVRASMEEHGVTLISLVPTMVQRLLTLYEGRPWPASLRHVLVGGAAAGQDLVRECLELGIPISTTYGLTEAASQVATMTTRQLRNKPGSVGRPLLFNEVEIVDEKGVALPAGMEGEIVVNGPIVMAGYDGDTESTNAALRDGRLFTGDIGYLDQDGDLWLVQRRSDMIISGGENIYPAEVEAVLMQHAAVTRACVVGLPDQEWGQQVAAAIVAGEAVSEEDLRNHCRERLAGYKVPRRFVMVADLPLTSSGKVARQVVAEQLAAVASRINLPAE